MLCAISQNVIQDNSNNRTAAYWRRFCQTMNHSFVKLKCACLCILVSVTWSENTYKRHQVTSVEIIIEKKICRELSNIWRALRDERWSFILENIIACYWAKLRSLELLTLNANVRENLWDIKDDVCVTHLGLSKLLKQKLHVLAFWYRMPLVSRSLTLMSNDFLTNTLWKQNIFVNM